MSPVFRMPDDPKHVTADVRGEIETHLELRAKEFEAQGMPPEEARRAAVAAFGDRAAIESECRDLRGATVRRRTRRNRLAEASQDIRVALRGLRRSPGFTLIAVLTLALTIGANAAIFSVVRSVLLRPLPYPESHQLVQLWTDHTSKGRTNPEWFSPPEFEEWRRSNRTFSGMASYGGWGPDLTGAGGDPEALAGVAVSWNMPSVLGVVPALGRSFVEADDNAGAERVVLLSDALWRRRFGADSSLLGRTLDLSGEPWTVIGVLPRGFQAPFNAEIWRPFRRAPNSGCQWGCVVLRAIGRMKQGVTHEQARSDLAGVARRIAEEQPQTNAGIGALLVPLHEQIVGETRPALMALSAAVALVLLIGCVNLANLLLVRGSLRGRELSVRAALGAGRGRLLRQLLTESAVLAAVGGLLGLGLAVGGARLLSGLVPQQVRSVQAIGVDAVVIMFTLLVTVLAGLLFGLLPAARSARADLMSSLRSAGRDTAGRSGALRRGLVVAQLALAVILLVGAGLLLRSFLRLQRVDMGFRTAELVQTGMAFPRVRYAEASRAVVAVEDLLDRLRAHPEVRRAEAADMLPLIGGGDQDMGVLAVGEAPPTGLPQAIWTRSVTSGYLSLMGMRIVEGRDFTPEDRAGSARVGIVNEEAARRFWHGKSPIGRILANGDDSTAYRMTIIGVVANARHNGPNQPYKAELFMPLSQFTSRGVFVVLEPARNPTDAVAGLRESLRAVDPLVPLSPVRAMDELAAEAVALPRVYALLIGMFAAAALGLAGLGVYGVMSYAVAQRQREIGVRLALGAGPGAIRTLVLGEGTRLAVLGVVIGVAGALAGARLLRSLLFEVSSLDLVAFAGAPLVLAGLALLAAYIPARRAMRVDPLVAIREE
jgi:predicted permease